MDKLKVKMLTDNIDGNCRVILLRDNFEIYNDRSCNLSKNLKEMEVITFKYNHDLKVWEGKVRRKMSNKKFYWECAKFFAQVILGIATFYMIAVIVYVIGG